eukprot:Em0017g715a
MTYWEKSDGGYMDMVLSQTVATGEICSIAFAEDVFHLYSVALRTLPISHQKSTLFVQGWGNYNSWSSLDRFCWLNARGVAKTRSRQSRSRSRSRSRESRSRSRSRSQEQEQEQEQAGAEQEQEQEQ